MAGPRTRYAFDAPFLSARLGVAELKESSSRHSDYRLPDPAHASSARPALEERPIARDRASGRRVGPLAACIVLLVAGLVSRQGVATMRIPHSLLHSGGYASSVLDISVLVFREGLECVLVIAAVAGGIAKNQRSYRKALALGVLIGLAAAGLTWMGAIRVLNDLGQNVSALSLQAATGLLAVVALLVVMNWFFHKVYWTGWISLHNRRKQRMLALGEQSTSRVRVLWGMGLLGFTSLYREGFEVVLFLQGYRLKFGSRVVGWGVLIGLGLSAVVAFLTLLANRKLPYRKMLVLTGVLLGLVLIVMVGEQAQEMQLAHWIRTTPIPWLVKVIPSWMGLWFSIFPTWETLLAQAAAAILVLGSYIGANRNSNIKNQALQTRDMPARKQARAKRLVRFTAYCLCLAVFQAMFGTRSYRQEIRGATVRARLGPCQPCHCGRSRSACIAGRDPADGAMGEAKTGTPK
jgi:high-affinity iron transporter